MGGREWAGWSGVKGEKWDKCNSIINKYILKNSQINNCFHLNETKIFNGNFKQNLLKCPQAWDYQDKLFGGNFIIKLYLQ